MKYLKLLLAFLLLIISSIEFFIWGFLPFMLFWSIYSCIYLAIGFYQKFHTSSVRSQIISLLYIFVPLVYLIIYSIKNGFPEITRTFYIIFIVALVSALIWEVISLILIIMRKTEEKDHKE